ncbi:hypothetical protein PACTADRAFT_86475 [Pachysolen tannophilus NRRL Y-2460]|uniref:Uncharacterized protein n=1 Tax=Pachysolen tannophilus NRRL Y-2460 TaxID=669874 RepID=A0A1E4TR79_PACTA|nr:hypothetical protein PACTADRAFT_86475 [Pachysolen tannophilus NRRL Y-2460]
MLFNIAFKNAYDFVFNIQLSIVKKLDNQRLSKFPTETVRQPPQPNSLDYLIDDIFQLLSLCFMAVGLTKTAPATYASLSTVQRLLEHLDESGVYTNLELNPIRERLQEIRNIINMDYAELEDTEQDLQGVRHEDNGFDDDEVFVAQQQKDGTEIVLAKKDENKLLRNKLTKCERKLDALVNKINSIPENLQHILTELITIRRTLMNLITRAENFDPKDLENLRKELSKIENSKELIDYISSSTSETSEGGSTKNQVLINGLLDDCHNLISDLLANNVEKVDASLKPLYNQLIELKTNLENLFVTWRWTLRATDLFSYQKTLQDIDNRRKNGFFVNPEGECPAKGQDILLYLLRRCYAIIYKLLESSEPVSEALQPIHNQLSTVRRCLLDVKRMGGISSIRELYPYQMKLASVDNLREDGKFMVDEQIPEGQGTLNALLAECFDIVHELKIEYYENEENKKETTKSGSADRQNDDDDDDDDENDAVNDVEGDGDGDGNYYRDFTDDGYDSNLPSYAASVNESEIPTDVERSKK